MLFAYFAPETTLPLASTAAAAVGVVMMFGKAALRFVKGFLSQSARQVSGSLAEGPAGQSS